MKSLISILILVIGATSHASEAPGFSAFNVGDNLYVTVLGDSCNPPSLGLIVDPSCRSDRKTKNLALTCKINFSISSTAMGCEESETLPYVQVFSLKENKIAPESKILFLSGIEVKLDK